MITRQKKEQIVADLVEKFRGAQALYLLDFKGMTVDESISLRRKLKESELVYKIAKNSLILRALEEFDEFDLPQELFTGETGIVFSYEDPVAPAKIIKEAFDKDKRPNLKGALLDGQYFDGSQLKQLAALPGRDDMMSAIVGSLHSPVSGIVMSINAVMRDVAYLVEEVAKKKAS